MHSQGVSRELCGIALRIVRRISRYITASSGISRYRTRIFRGTTKQTPARAFPSNTIRREQAYKEKEQTFVRQKTHDYRKIGYSQVKSLMSTRYGAPGECISELAEWKDEQDKQKEIAAAESKSEG